MYYEDYSYARQLFRDRDYRACYDELSKYDNRNDEWYYMRGVSAMNLGYYDEGEDYIKRAKFMDPENREYQSAYEQYINYRNVYNHNANNYNYRRHNLDNSGCCCCCDSCCFCGNGCCDDCCKLIICDQCCECMGGDLIPCC